MRKSKTTKRLLKLASENPSFRRSLIRRLARHQKGVSVPLEDLPEEFQENVKNPPPSVREVRERMLRSKKASIHIYWRNFVKENFDRERQDVMKQARSAGFSRPQALEIADLHEESATAKKWAQLLTERFPNGRMLAGM